MATQGDVEDGQKRSCPLDEVAGEKGTEGEAGEQACVEVPDGDTALGWGRAVAGVRVDEDAAGSERTCQAVEKGADQDPAVVDGVRVLPGEDNRDLGDDTADGTDGHHPCATITIREGSKLGCSESADDAHQDADAQREACD